MSTYASLVAHLAAVVVEPSGLVYSSVCVPGEPRRTTRCEAWLATCDDLRRALPPKAKVTTRSYQRGHLEHWYSGPDWVLAHACFEHLPCWGDDPSREPDLLEVAHA